MAEPRKLTGFSIFGFSDEITINRVGKTVHIKGRDGAMQSSDSVESNILFEILKEMRKKK